MISIILRAATAYIAPLQLLFSLFLLLRGHNEPGGGFIAGLVASSSFILYLVAFDVKKARQMLGLNPTVLIGSGLLVACTSGIPGLIAHKPYLTGVWLGKMPIPGLGYLALGSPLFFDLGVYIVVVGITLHIIFSLAGDNP